MQLDHSKDFGLTMIIRSLQNEIRKTIKEESRRSQQQQQLSVCFCGVEAHYVPGRQCRPQPSLYEMKHLAGRCGEIISTVPESCVSLLED